MTFAFRTIWIYRIATDQVSLTRTFPSVERRHKNALAVAEQIWSRDGGDCGNSKGKSKGNVGDSSDGDSSGGANSNSRRTQRTHRVRHARSRPTRRWLEAQLKRVLREVQTREHPEVPVVDLGTDLWPIVAVFRVPQFVVLGLPLIPACNFQTPSPRPSVFHLPEITAAAEVLEMIATHCVENNVGSFQGRQTGQTAALARVQALLSIMLPFGSPVEVRSLGIGSGMDLLMLCSLLLSRFVCHAIPCQFAFRQISLSQRNDSKLVMEGLVLLLLSAMLCLAAPRVRSNSRHGNHLF